ncbi:MAG: hemolysin family protein [Verrucomicrobiota bacterium]|nr:hemolysin family protein [Verrucomicrobiota bacterium]
MDWNEVIVISLLILAVGILVFLNGFFVAAEFALVKLRDTQLEPLVSKGHRRARMARHILDNLDAYLSACQLGITLASLALGYVGHPIFDKLLGPIYDWNVNGGPLLKDEYWRHTISIGVGFLVITILHIVVGEVAPKRLAIQRPLTASLWAAYPLRWFYWSMYPFIWVLNSSALWLLRKTGLDTGDELNHSHSEEELRILIGGTGDGSAKDAFRRGLVLNAFDLKRRIARDVMRPRREIVGFNTKSNINECLEIAEQTRHSRFPLCVDGNLDQTHGVIHIKDLYAQRHSARTAEDLADFSRELVYAPETAKLEGLLQIFLNRKLHFGLVVNEYGDTVGMVTLENILEELVGQIQDEFDHEKPLFEQLDKTTWSVQGIMPLHELAELTGEDCDEKGVTTVSGLITKRLGSFPKVGDVLELDNYEIRVEQTFRLQVEQARLTRLSDSKPIDDVEVNE